MIWEALNNLNLGQTLVTRVYAVYTGNVHYMYTGNVHYITQIALPPGQL